MTLVRIHTEDFTDMTLAREYTKLVYDANDDNDDNDDNGNYLQRTMPARLGKLSQLDLMKTLISITCREQC